MQLVQHRIASKWQSQEWSPRGLAPQPRSEPLSYAESLDAYILESKPNFSSSPKPAILLLLYFHCSFGHRVQGRKGTQRPPAFPPVGSLCVLTAGRGNAIPETFLSISRWTFRYYFFGRAARIAGSQFPSRGLNPCPLQWKHRVLTTGLPGNSLRQFFFYTETKPRI